MYAPDLELEIDLGDPSPVRD